MRRNAITCYSTGGTGGSAAEVLHNALNHVWNARLLSTSLQSGPAAVGMCLRPSPKTDSIPPQDRPGWAEVGLDGPARAPLVSVFVRSVNRFAHQRDDTVKGLWMDQSNGDLTICQAGLRQRKPVQILSLRARLTTTVVPAAYLIQIEPWLSQRTSPSSRVVARKSSSADCVQSHRVPLSIATRTSRMKCFVCLLSRNH